MLKFSDFGLHPSLNILPEGSLQLGAPAKDMAIGYETTETDTEKKRMVLMESVVQILTEAEKEGRITRKTGPTAVFFVWKDNVTAALNNGNDFYSPQAWTVIRAKTSFEENRKNISALAKAVEIRNAAVIVETENEDLYPVGTTRDELLEWMAGDLRPKF